MLCLGCGPALFCFHHRTPLQNLHKYKGYFLLRLLKDLKRWKSVYMRRDRCLWSSFLGFAFKLTRLKERKVERKIRGDEKDVEKAENA